MLQREREGLRLAVLSDKGADFFAMYIFFGAKRGNGYGKIQNR